MPTKITRHHSRIWFDEGGPDKCWSVEDPVFPLVGEEIGKATDAKLFYVRGLASTLLYLICQCPTTERAQEQIALMRRALRTVENPYNAD